HCHSPHFRGHRPDPRQCRRPTGANQPVRDPHRNRVPGSRHRHHHLPCGSAPPRQPTSTRTNPTPNHHTGRRHHHPGRPPQPKPGHQHQPHPPPARPILGNQHHRNLEY